MVVNGVIVSDESTDFFENPLSPFREFEKNREFDLDWSARSAGNTRKKLEKIG